MTKPRNKMLEPPKNLLRPVVSDIHRRSFVFVDIYRSKSECIIKLINVRSFTKAFGICRHSPANVDIHYFRTLTVTYTWPFQFQNKSVPRKQTMHYRKVATSAGPFHNFFFHCHCQIVKLNVRIVRFWKYFLTLLCSVFNYNIYCSVFGCRVWFRCVHFNLLISSDKQINRQTTYDN
jgi:hypothetical protein